METIQTQSPAGNIGISRAEKINEIAQQIFGDLKNQGLRESEIVRISSSILQSLTNEMKQRTRDQVK